MSAGLPLSLMALFAPRPPPPYAPPIDLPKNGECVSAQISSQSDLHAR